MPFTSLRLSPGLVRNTTRYAVSGTWFDSSMVHFRNGHPEKWDGWVERYLGFTFVGVGRSLHRHGTLDGQRWTSLGTNNRFYMVTDGAVYNVTPSLGSSIVPNSLSTTNGSNLLTIIQTNHGKYPGDTVTISGAVAVDAVPAGDINRTHTVTTWIDTNRYTVTVATTATSTVSNGGGASISISYPFIAGSADAVSGGGWGALAWNEEEWGGDYDAPASEGGVVPFGEAEQIGIWTQENWGEDLVANAQSGPIFYWDADNPSNAMVDILDLPGAGPYAPQEAQFIIVSHRDRHLLAFGCTLWGSSVVEPMTFRWCDQQDIFDWDESSTINTAGSLPLSMGSKLLAGISTAREIIVWSDQAMYSIQYIGPPYIYAADLLEKWSDICGLKAVTTFNGIVYWMGKSGVYAYTGRTEKLVCPVWDYVSNRLNREQIAKVHASSNKDHDEVIFFYPSNTSGNLEIDSYFAFDTVESVWTFGSLVRTAWLDSDSIDAPFAVSTDGKLYEHEQGSDDGSTTPASPINAFIESGPIELSSEGAYDKGDRTMFVRRVVPDVTFREITTSSDAPSVNFTLKMMDFPGGGLIPMESSSSPAQRSVTIPVEQFTTDSFIRLRGRSLTIRLESNTTGTNWRLGIPRIDVRTDGQQ